MKYPPHTIIYTHGGGRFGNQVLRFIHWIAWARANEGQVEVLNLAMWPYANLFAYWRHHRGVIFPSRPTWTDRTASLYASLPRLLLRPVENRYLWQRAIHQMGRWNPKWQAIALDDAKGERWDLHTPQFLALIAACSFTTCSGWQYASWHLVAQQQTELRKYFEPAPDASRSAKEFVTTIRRRYDVLVGVLIRQADYRGWIGGKFCFSTANYVRWMQELMELHSGQRVGFVVASDEFQDPSAFAGLPFHFSSGAVNTGGPWFQSWVELALCDFILSPPSTFSATASFVGGLPLWPLSDPNQTLNFNQLIQNGMIGASIHPEFSQAVK